MPKKLWILNTLPNGVAHLIMPLSTTKNDKILHNLLPILNTWPKGGTFVQGDTLKIRTLSRYRKNIFPQ